MTDDASPSGKERAPKLVKLHPNLEGKRVLLVESWAWYRPLKSMFDLEKATLEHVEALSSLRNETREARARLADYLSQNHMEGVVIHPVVDQAWIDEIIEAHTRGFRVVILTEDRVQKEAGPMYERFESLGMPLVLKRDLDAFEQIVDVLDTMFRP